MKADVDRYPFGHIRGVAIRVVLNVPPMAADDEGPGLDGIAVAEPFGSRVALDLENVRPGSGWGDDGRCREAAAAAPNMGTVPIIIGRIIMGRVHG